MLGVHPKVTGHGRKHFGSYKEERLDLMSSRFITFEIDLAGQ